MWGFLSYKFNFTTSNQPFHIVSSWFSLGRLSVSRNLFTSRFPICWYITISIIFLWFFCIPVVSYIISPPSYLILFRSSIFYSWWYWVKLINFIYHLKKTALGFNVFLFYLCFLLSLLFPSFHWYFLISHIWWFIATTDQPEFHRCINFCYVYSFLRQLWPLTSEWMSLFHSVACQLKKIQKTTICCNALINVSFHEASHNDSEMSEECSWRQW